MGIIVSDDKSIVAITVTNTGPHGPDVPTTIHHADGSFTRVEKVAGYGKNPAVNVTFTDPNGKFPEPSMSSLRGMTFEYRQGRAVANRIKDIRARIEMGADVSRIDELLETLLVELEPAIAPAGTYEVRPVNA